MDKSIQLAPKELCTGCGACMKKCSKGAISFIIDDEGFPTPYIQEEFCVSCGQCNRVCPAINKPETHSIISAYAVQTVDSLVLRESTSGGLFTTFAREIFQRDGVVYGCVWDENYNAVFRKAESEDDIVPMRGSKYVWSWAGDTFPEIKLYLDSGRDVLFFGLPCQVAALRNYLSHKYDNLFLIDFLCSGAPSPLAFNCYLDTICSPDKRKNLNLKFRNKIPYGVGVHISYNGKKKINKKGDQFKNSYYWSFYTRLIDRNSCYLCDYGSGDRVSDITLGDYWGISNYHDEFNILDGVSALLVNTEKGVQLINCIKKDIKIVETDPRNISKANNLFIYDKKRNVHKPLNRDKFFKTLRDSGWKVAEKKYLYSKGRILRIIKSMLPSFIVKLFR